MAIWALVSYGFGIFFVEQLNAFHLGGFPLGFWFAQQGSISAKARVDQIKPMATRCREEGIRVYGVVGKFCTRMSRFRVFLFSINAHNPLF